MSGASPVGFPMAAPARRQGAARPPRPAHCAQRCYGAGENAANVRDGAFRKLHETAFEVPIGAKGDRGDHVWLLRVLAQPGGMRFDGVEFLRADTHRGWGIASMARAAARWARFS